MRPPGPISLHSEGAIQLTNGIRSTFRVEELNFGQNWMWVGPFLWLAVHYDHQFHKIGPEETEVSFVLDGDGFGVSLFGRLFAAIYARNLDRAISCLVKELEE